MTIQLGKSIQEIQVTTPVIGKNHGINLEKAPSGSTIKYIGMRWTNPTGVDVDTAIIVLDENYQGVSGSYIGSSLTYRQLSNDTLKASRSKDDTTGSDLNNEPAIDLEGNKIQIIGQNADDERACINLPAISEEGGKYVLVTADMYSHGTTFGRNLSDAWLRIADVSKLTQSKITAYGRELPTVIGGDEALVNLNSLGDSKGALIGFFALDEQNQSWSWTTKVQPYPCQNAGTYKEVFDLLKTAGKPYWDNFFSNQKMIESEVINPPKKRNIFGIEF